MSARVIFGNVAYWFHFNIRSLPPPPPADDLEELLRDFSEIIGDEDQTATAMTSRTTEEDPKASPSAALKMELPV